jgi:nitrilase
MYPRDSETQKELEGVPDVLSRGGSAVVTPMGDIISGPLYDKEGVLLADLDMTMLSQTRFDYDTVGHYNRPDVFKLFVNEDETPPAHFVKRS